MNTVNIIAEVTLQGHNAKLYRQLMQEGNISLEEFLGGCIGLGLLSTQFDMFLKTKDGQYISLRDLSSDDEERIAP